MCMCMCMCVLGKLNMIDISKGDNKSKQSFSAKHSSIGLFHSDKRELKLFPCIFIIKY